MLIGVDLLGLCVGLGLGLANGLDILRDGVIGIAGRDFDGEVGCDGKGEFEGDGLSGEESCKAGDDIEAILSEGVVYPTLLGTTTAAATSFPDPDRRKLTRDSSLLNIPLPCGFSLSISLAFPLLSLIVSLSFPLLVLLSTA